MRHKGLLTAVSLGLAAIVFVVVWLLGGVWWALGASLLIFAASMLVIGRIYVRSTAVINRHAKRLQQAGEPVLYADIASIMLDAREVTGAMLVTPQRFLFITPPRRKNYKEMEIFLKDIALAQEVRGYFRMAAGGRELRFKVFYCEKLVAVIHGAIDALGAENASLIAGPRAEEP